MCILLMDFLKHFNGGYMRSDTKVLKIKFQGDIYNIEKHGDWFDLRTVEDVHMERGDFVYIPLGVAIELPKGYEAIVAPRSSTFKKFGIIQANSIGIIDEDYCGDNDEWHFPAYCLRREVDIPAGTRICQFRIIEHQPPVAFTISSELGNKNRGGLGSTGL